MQSKPKDQCFNVVILHSQWMVLLRAPLLLCFPQTGFLGVGSGCLRWIRFFPAVCGLGHRLSPATTAALQHPDRTTSNGILTSCRCCFLQGKYPQKWSHLADQICPIDCFQCPTSIISSIILEKGVEDTRST